MGPDYKQIDRIIEFSLSQAEPDVVTDKYFSHSAIIADRNGDSEVTYAIFMRRPVIAALGVAIGLCERLVPGVKIERFFEDGRVVPPMQKMFSITGSYKDLSVVETLILQKVGFACVAAYNAYRMCLALPFASFMDMHARHGTGPEMNLLMAYGASVGSAAAQNKDKNVQGFTGSSQDLTAPLFGAEKGIGTMPHALVGYTDGDALAATKLFVETIPDATQIISLVDYAGLEVSDALTCANWFYNEAQLDKQGKTFGVRLDTHGGRFAENLTFSRSVDIVGEWLDIDGEYEIVEYILGVRAFALDVSSALIDRTRRFLYGQGVSAANIIQMRRALDDHGFDLAQIVASSGFDRQKCLVMGAVNAPIDMVGTGSFLPTTMAETYATADIITYDGEKRVKLGREFLL